MKREKVKTKAMVFAICVVFLATMSIVTLASTGTNTQDKQSGIFEKKELNHAPSVVEYVPDEILVKFKPDVGEEAITTMNFGYRTSVKSTLLSGTKILHVPSGKTVDEMVTIYEGLPGVEYAEPDYVVHAFMVQNDPFYTYQWHLDNDEYGGINMESAWDTSTGYGAVVAVLDTGVAYEDYDIYCQAPDLAGTAFVQGYDFVNNDAHPNDDEGHGTHVTGTVAQATNNDYGVAGVAFDCSIMPVKVLNETGSGTYSWLADGIYYAVDNGADVISMSLGGPKPSQTLEDAVTYAYNEGVTIVAAAGNEYEKGNTPQYPAAYDDYVIAVGATRYNETRSYYSNTGSYLDLVAPGSDTRVDQNGDGYADGVLQQTFPEGDPCDFGFWFYQGTSMATPHVSGVAALLIANDVTGPDNVRNRLESTAEDKGSPGRDEEYGWGIVDAYTALLSDEECEGTATSCGIYPNCENCNDYDGCYAYGNGCEERNYYCYSNEVGCEYTYSNRHTDYYDGWDYYCKGDEVWKRRLFHDFYCDGGSCTNHTSWVDDQLVVDNCNDHDGWYCNGDVKEYRDYYCSGGSCTYTVTSSENCNNYDGCYAYGDGCEDRDYYCFGGSCVYTYSNRHTDYYDDWVPYCKEDEVWKRRQFHDFYCEEGSCVDHTSWVDDPLVENCNNYDGWVDTGNMRWVDDPANECKEKEQKEQEYRDYTCSDGSCTYSITNTQWIDIGNTRNKPDGTICGYGEWEDDPANPCKERREILKCVSGTCSPSGEYEYQSKPDGTICGCTANNTLKRCDVGICSDTGICNSTLCGADIACDGKKPGDLCNTNKKCNSNCKCQGPEVIFDTGNPANPYPSIFGTHNGTIKPNQTITVQKLYTYPCAGTGGHTEYTRIWNNSGLNATANWSGYTGDWHTITFNETFVLYKNKTYNYTLRTGSYPQIIHAKSKDAIAGAGTINCTKFIDANGKIYNNWIPAIKLFH